MSIRSLLALAAGLLLSSSALADSRVLTSIKPIQQISAALLDGIDEPAVLLPPGALAPCLCPAPLRPPRPVQRRAHLLGRPGP